MATLKEYVELASDVYQSWASSNDAPRGWLVEPGMFVDDSPFWNAGSSITSSGLQCRAYRRVSGGEAVIAYKGTNPKMTSDLRADAALSIYVVPTQMKEALTLTEGWKATLGKKGCRISLTGHSLGGGISQYVGARLGIRFVTFNAPGMLANTSGICASPYTKANTDMGMNYIFWGDTIGNFGRHVGDTQRLRPRSIFNPVPLKQHFLSNFKSLLLAHDPDFPPDLDPLKR